MPKEAWYKFVYSSTVDHFIHSILGNKEVDESIANQTDTLISLLSVPTCQLKSFIKMDFDYIGVLPDGTLFNIPNKSFTTNEDALKGKNYS